MTHVMIIDDQPANRLLLGALARSIALDVIVTTFEDPAIALQACQADDPDLVVTDFKMSGMTGAEFVRRLRMIEGCHEIPAIVLTAYDERALRMEALAAGATDFLLSPFDHAEFVARASNLLKLRRQHRLIEGKASQLAHALKQSERHRREIIRDSGEALAQVIDTVPAFIMATDREGRCIFVNASQAFHAGGVPFDFAGRGIDELLGVSRRAKSNALDQQVFALGKSIASYEEDIDGPDGQTKTLLTTKTPLRDANLNVIGVVTTSLDITSRKLAEDRLTRMALRDALTDLPNRYLLDDLLQRLVTLPPPHNAGAALLVLDLDRFKNINDSLGHHAGDELLQNVAQRLQRACRAGDTVARLGGDEFAILQTGMTHHEDTIALALRVIDALSQPVLSAGVSVRVTCSIGITLFPADGCEAATLYRNADLAMYQAKAEGKNRYRFFQPAMNDRAKAAIQMEADLRRALDAEEFRLLYQPLLDLHSGRVVGFEALIRWQRPGHGLVPPLVFLPVAEEAGLVGEIGAWMTRTALLEAASWQAIDGRPIRIAINISPVQFGLQDVSRLIKDAVFEAGLEPSLVDLELTEGTLLDDSPQTAKALRDLSDFGLKLSLDDFGTGFASMTYVKRIPVQRIKIDRSFVQGLPASRPDAAVVGSLIALGRTLSVPVLGEGVETMSQLIALRDAGCDEAQGFLIGRPQEAAAVPDIIRGDAGLWQLPANAASPPES